MRPPHTAKRGLVPTDSVGSIGEHALIDRLTRRLAPGPAHVALGVGDDAAALEPTRSALTVLTVDSLVEDVHFRRGSTAPEAVGHKALAVGLSDLAAMGAEPRACLLSLALPDALLLAEFDALLDGLIPLANASRAVLVGGNITRSPGPLMVDVTVVGAAGRRKMLTRSGARPGDELFVTGWLGAAAAGLIIIEAGTSRDALDAGALACLERYERPEPRLRCGLAVARSRTARACIDLSDGLADGARQIARASGVGVVIKADDVPVHPGLVASVAGPDAGLRLALSGGEDYELLFAVAPRRRRAFFSAAGRCRGLGVTKVGVLTKEAGLWLERNGRREPLGEGYEHFAAEA